MITYQKFCTTNDVNGNPRRGWLIGLVTIETSPVYHVSHRNIAWADEGYEGNAALDRALHKALGDRHDPVDSPRKLAADLGTVRVTPSEYRAIRKAGQS